MNAFRYGWPLLAIGLTLAAGCGGTAVRTSTAAGTTSPRPTSQPERPAPTCPAAQADPSGGVASSPFVPGDPAEATVCRYAGLTAPHPRALIGARVLRGRALTAVRTGLNAQPAAAGGRYACPQDDGAAHVLMFGYRDGSVVRIRVVDSGCHLADNGQRIVRTPSGLAKQLD